MKKIVFMALLLLTAVGAQAQDGDDFGLDFSAAVEKKLAKGLSVDAELDYRTQDNTSRTERWGVGVGIDWRFYQSADKKWNLKAFGGFEYIWKHNLSETKDHYNTSGVYNGYNVTDCYWVHRQRYSIGAAVNYKPVKRFNIQLRETFQFNHYNAVDGIDRQKYRHNDDDEIYLKETDTKTKEAKDRSVLRSKLTLSYNFKEVKLEPFVSVDYGVGLNYTANKWKFAVGTDYNITKQHRLTCFYRYNTDDDDDEPNGHLIGLGYKFSF